MNWAKVAESIDSSAGDMIAGANDKHLEFSLRTNLHHMGIFLHAVAVAINAGLEDGTDERTLDHK